MTDSDLKALQAAVNAAQPLLQTEQRRHMEKEREARLCILCTSEAKAFAPRQCGHLLYCETCKPPEDTLSSCAVCRTAVAPGDWMRIYA